MALKFQFCSLSRWNNDLQCVGPFPKNFENIERTMRDLRKSKFGKSPGSLEEIAHEFNKPHIVEELGTSLHRDKGVLFNSIQIESDYCNCIFSSPHSISLMKKNLETHERFYLMDATFRITPRGLFQQVLIIYVQYGIKVSSKIFIL